MSFLPHLMVICVQVNVQIQMKYVYKYEDWLGNPAVIASTSGKPSWVIILVIDKHM